MTTGTDLVVLEKGAYVALSHTPDDVKAILADSLGDEELTEQDLPKIKIPSGGATVWMVPGAAGPTATEKLEGVVVFWKRSKAYWPNPDPTGEPPACVAADNKHGVGNPGGICKTCPFNEFGSSIKTEKGKACKESEFWFLLQPGSFLPLVLKLPATSLDNAKKHRIAIGNAGIKLASTVVSITLVSEQGPSGAYSIAVPKLGAMLAPEDAERALAYAATMRADFEAAAQAMNTETDADTPRPETPAPPAGEAPPWEGQATEEPPATGYSAEQPVAAQAAEAAQAAAPFEPASDVTPAGATADFEG